VPGGVAGVLMLADAGRDQPAEPGLSTPGTSVAAAPIASAPPTTETVAVVEQPVAENEDADDQGKESGNGKKNGDGKDKGKDDD
jgi:hypothetical protein